jgi:hypothetical protein
MKTYKSFVFALFALFYVFTVSAQSPDKIINKYIKAIGGKKVISNIKSIYAEGTMDIMDMQVTIKMTTLNEKGTKQEIDIMGNNMITCYNEKGGWIINPLAGVTSAEDMAEGQYNAGKDQIVVEAPFINYKDKGYKVELMGTESVGNSKANKIIMTTQDNISSVYYFDTKTHYLLQSIQNTELQGQMQQTITSFSDFKKINGYTYAKEMDININDGQLIMKIIITKFELDIAVDESIFQKPQ